MNSVITFLLVGLVAGWLAGKLLGAKSDGLVVDLLIGVVGAFIGGSVFDRLGVVIRGMPNMLVNLIAATVGAVILLILLRFIRK